MRRLRELEFIERISEKISTITLSTGWQTITARLVRRTKPESEEVVKAIEAFLKNP